ncbi:MAG TPA: type VI secretion system tube protein Hcp [Burkholderiaceae bacterium]|nr:type VI secretion system tube protein Hcp [Burkholderiaceae bacterium]
MILLKFETPIKGSSKVHKHEHWIPINNCSIDVARDIHVSGDGRSPSVAKFEDIEFERPTDFSSSELFIQAVAGKSLGKAEIHFIQTGGVDHADQVYLIILLDQPLITSYKLSGQGDDQPTETFKVHFQKISYQYNAFDGAKITTGTPKGWDRFKNEKWAA